MLSLEKFKQDISGKDMQELGHLLEGHDEFVFSVSWITAGQSGGDCWGRKPKRIQAECEPVEVFDEIVLKVFRYITGHDIIEQCTESYVKDVYDNSILTTAYSDKDYDGNWTESDIRYISPETIFGVVYNHSRIARIDTILEDLESNNL